MRGLLVDENLQGHLRVLRRLFKQLELQPFLDDARLELRTFAEIGFSRDLDDRSVWIRCQREGWVLFTENRNLEGPNSLQAVLEDSWKVGNFPVVTLANKSKFQRDGRYALQVAAEVADILIGITLGEFLDQPRIFVPRD